MSHGGGNNTTTKKTKLPHWFINFLAGGVAGCTAKTIIAPLERVKILFQVKSQQFAFTGVVSSINKIIKQEGAIMLWKGNTATIVRVYPYAAIQFMSYEQYKKLIIGDTKRPHPLQHLVCGSLAGMTAVTFTYPLDLIRARMASQVIHDVYKNIFHGLVTMYNVEGLRSWFRGMWPSIQGIIPYAGVNFATYEFLKKNYAQKDEKGEVTVVGKLICGGISGPIGQTVAYPWDTVRRRMQIWGFAPGTEFVAQKSTTKAMIYIVQTEGLKGLFRGISLNYLKATPTVAISFAVYEVSKGYLERM